MTSVIFAIPGNIDLPTGGYAYGRRVLARLPAAGIEVKHVRLPGSFPNPGAKELAESERALADTPSEAVLLIDGLAYGALPADLIQRLDRRIVALVHHPLCLEAGLSKARQNELWALEQAALGQAREIIVTSAATAKTLQSDFAVPEAKITVAEPGTDPAPRAKGTGQPLQLLAVGSVVPRKAFDILVRGLASAPKADWRLTIVGPTDRHADALAALKRAIAETGMGVRISLAGPASQDGLNAHYDAADIFALPSLYEGYGMVLAEAMARGLPIVCTTGGAASDTVPDAAGIKVPPGDVQALSEALGRVMSNPRLRQQMADASWAAGQRLPRWEATAERVAGVLRRAAA